MRQNNKEVRFKKISLQMLIDTLTHIYNSGIQNDEQDVINIVVKEDYMTDEELEEYDEEEQDEDDDLLSDEDINNLI